MCNAQSVGWIIVGHVASVTYSCCSLARADQLKDLMQLESADAPPLIVEARPSFGELARVFARIGLTSFGGPAAQIALMHRELVDERKWLGEQQYLAALNFCMLLPGPEAMQLATYVGWRLHGLRGGLAAGLLFLMPGAVLVFGLALVYANVGQLPLASAVFLGIKAAVLAIVVQALLRIARRALRGAADWLIAAMAFLGLFAFNVPFPLIVAAAGLIGTIFAVGPPVTQPLSPAPVIPISQTLATIATGVAIWVVPLLAVALTFGFDHVLTQLALFFSKLAVVTFGGAYAVLTYMAQDVVQRFGWLQAGEMLDALGLAETTPGPLILVTEFVGTLAAWRHGGGPPLAMAALGALVSLWATFVPCFVWIFAGAPYIECINAAPRLASALAAVTAAVVGVILNLSVWFALHVLFAQVATSEAGFLKMTFPVLSSLDVKAAALSVMACVLLFGLRLGILFTLALMAAASVLLTRVV